MSMASKRSTAPQVKAQRLPTLNCSRARRRTEFFPTSNRPSINFILPGECRAAHHQLAGGTKSSDQLSALGRCQRKSLREQAEAIRDELTSLSDVTNVKIQGVRPLQTTVEIRRETLREHKLTLPMVAQALRRASLDAPGGSIKTRGGDILIRTKDQRFTRTEFAEITLLSGLDGSRLRLGDIAEIREEFKEVDSYSTYNGKTAVILNIERVGTQTPRSVAGAVKDYRAGLVESLPRHASRHPARLVQNAR